MFFTQIAFFKKSLFVILTYGVNHHLPFSLQRTVEQRFPAFTFWEFIKIADFTEEVDCYSAWIILASHAADRNPVLQNSHSCECYMGICSFVLQRSKGFAGKITFFERAQQYLLWRKKKVLTYYLIQLSKITAILCSHLNIILWFSGIIWLGRYCWQQVSIYVPSWNRSGDSEAANRGT